MNDLDELFDKLFEDPAFARVYREERITWELQARAVCRYLRSEIERLEADIRQIDKDMALTLNIANDIIEEMNWEATHE